MKTAGDANSVMKRKDTLNQSVSHPAAFFDVFSLGEDGLEGSDDVRY
jgi:hypothetical protein